MPALESAPKPCLDDVCLTRPLVLVAALVMAGHQIRGTATVRPAYLTPYPEEILHHA